MFVCCTCLFVWLYLGIRLGRYLIKFEQFFIERFDNIIEYIFLSEVEFIEFERSQTRTFIEHFDFFKHIY